MATKIIKKKVFPINFQWDEAIKKNKQRKSLPLNADDDNNVEKKEIT